MRYQVRNSPSRGRGNRLNSNEFAIKSREKMAINGKKAVNLGYRTLWFVVEALMYMCVIYVRVGMGVGYKIKS